jgi:hypothetical protein
VVQRPIIAFALCQNLGGKYFKAVTISKGTPRTLQF